ncbi:response regulator [Aneurinibacillus aneurinilyticus]|uniref:response regulator n=1 Tax=Aneurinibacillus aneurinilyticus TaxID=1391 RepID=UPI003523FA6D
MRAVLVDDEKLALNYLEKLLSGHGDFEIIGKYQNPDQAFEAIVRDKPDVVFLDIEMPGTNGIEMAERLERCLHNINIVFVTAYDEHAIKAFELNAIDYILKPAQRSRLIKTVQRLLDTHKDSETASPRARPVMIRCFQSLQIELPQSHQQPVMIRWRTSKAQELFAYLLHYRGQLVRKDALLELFWPETDWKKGFTQLYTTIYQVRKTLENTGADVHITSLDKGYRLDLNNVELDVQQWEEGINKALPITDNTLSEHLKLLNLYQGDYLADYDYLWAESERQRLREMWLRHALQVADYVASQGKHVEALALYQRIQLFHPHVEESYFMLMCLYDALGDRNSVELQYANLQEMLRSEFDVEPQQRIQLWYFDWKKKID